jgi:hypothetical protein
MKDEHGEEYIPLLNGKRLYIKDVNDLADPAWGKCPTCGLFRDETRVCDHCKREGCENCTCEQDGRTICMACDLGSEER